MDPVICRWAPGVKENQDVYARAKIIVFLLNTEETLAKEALTSERRRRGAQEGLSLHVFHFFCRGQDKIKLITQTEK